MAAVGMTQPVTARRGLAGGSAQEFTKIRSVRSTYWTLLVLLAVSVGLGGAISAATASHWNQMSPGDRPPSTRRRPASPGCSTSASW